MSGFLVFLACICQVHHEQAGALARPESAFYFVVDHRNQEVQGASDELIELIKQDMKETGILDVRVRGASASFRTFQIESPHIHRLDVYGENERNAPRVKIHLTAFSESHCLQKVSLFSVDLESFEPLSSLENLTHARFYGCDFSNLDSIGNLNRLESLHIFGTSARDLDVGPILRIGTLHELRIVGYRIPRLTALSQMKSLRYLGIDFSLLPKDDILELRRLNREIDIIDITRNLQ